MKDSRANYLDTEYDKCQDYHVCTALHVFFHNSDRHACGKLSMAFFYLFLLHFFFDFATNITCLIMRILLIGTPILQPTKKL